MNGVYELQRKMNTSKALNGNECNECTVINVMNNNAINVMNALKNNYGDGLFNIS